MIDKNILYNKAKESYYNGEPIMSDIEFDELEKELGLENKGYIGTHHQKSYTIEHPFLMGSLSKIQIKFDKEDSTIHFDEYVSQIKKYLDKSYSKIKQDYKNNWYFECTPKYDGCSFECVIDPVKGLVSVSTRGDGNFGKDIKLWFEEEYRKNIQPKLYNFFANNFDDHDFFFLEKFVIRGECLVKKDVFNKKYLGKFKMPRSFVAGVLGQDWEGTPEQIEMRNDLCWMCYDYREIYDNGTIIECDYSGHDDKSTQNYLETYSFKHIPGNKPSVEDGSMKIYSYKNIENFKDIYEYWEEYRKNCEFELDGFVIKPGALMRLQDSSRTRQEDCVAIKFTPEIVDAVIKDIEWNVGKTGEYFPTGILEPVIIGGKEVNRVSLANYQTLKKKRSGIGAKVKISLAGDIIPFVIEVVDISIVYNLPDDAYVNIIGDCSHLMKALDENDKRYIKFINSVNTLNIDGIGEKVADKLYQIKPTDNILTYLMEKNTLQEIENVLGEGKSTDNIINALMERKKQISLYDIILSLGIENCGEKNSMWLAKKLSGFNIDSKGIPTSVQNVISSEQTYGKIMEMMKMIGVGFLPVEETTNDKTKVILTGSPKSAGYATKGEFLKKIGNLEETTKWDECEILITDDLNSTSSKMKKAQSKKIIIKTYFDF